VNITIKGISSSVHKKLVERAARHQRSLNKEIIAVLEESTSPRLISPQSLIDELKQLQTKIKFSVSIGAIEDAIEAGPE
jgi:plasmid stability protein